MAAVRKMDPAEMLVQNLDIIQGNWGWEFWGLTHVKHGLKEWGVGSGCTCPLQTSCPRRKDVAHGRWKWGPLKCWRQGGSLFHPDLQVILSYGWVIPLLSSKAWARDLQLGDLKSRPPILPPKIQHTAKSAIIIRGPRSNYCVGVGHMSLSLLKP